MSKMVRFSIGIALISVAGSWGVSAPFARDRGPASDAIIAQSESRIFAIVLKPGPAWKRGKPFSEQGLGAHFRYLKALVDRGEIYAAGGLGNDHGLILLYAKDQERADVVLDNDPAVIQGTFIGEAMPYGISLLSKQPLAVAVK